MEMAHTCEDCGERFGTLSALRLHDCPEDEDAAAREWEKEAEEHMARIRTLEREENRSAKRATSSALTDALERAGADDLGAVHDALAHYERHLTEEWQRHRREEGDSYDGFHRVFYRESRQSASGSSENLRFS